MYTIVSGWSICLSCGLTRKDAKFYGFWTNRAGRNISGILGMVTDELEQEIQRRSEVIK